MQIDWLATDFYIDCKGFLLTWNMRYGNPINERNFRKLKSKSTFVVKTTTIGCRRHQSKTTWHLTMAKIEINHFYSVASTQHRIAAKQQPKRCQEEKQICYFHRIQFIVSFISCFAPFFLVYFSVNYFFPLSLTNLIVIRRIAKENLLQWMYKPSDR